MQKNSVGKQANAIGGRQRRPYHISFYDACNLGKQPRPIGKRAAGQALRVISKLESKKTADRKDPPVEKQRCPEINLRSGLLLRILHLLLLDGLDLVDQIVR